MIPVQQKIFDLSFLEQINDKNFLVEVIDIFLHDTNIDLEEMKLALDTGVLDTVYRMAHKLKSSTGMLQANALFNILEQTEEMAKAGNENNELAELVEKTEYEFGQLKTALELHLKVIQTAA